MSWCGEIMKKILLYSLKCFILSLVIGVLIAGFQFIAHEVIHLSEILLNKNDTSMIITILTALVICIGLIFVNKKIKGGLGSGVPQLEAYHSGWYKLSALPMLILIPINSFFAFFAAFLLGSEGPSIAIGGSSAAIINNISKEEDKELVASGGSAAFCCAFASPLAGITHLIEENKKYMKSPLFLLKGSVIIVLSFLISYLIYPHELLPFYECNKLPIIYYLYFILLIALSIAVGKLYSLMIIVVKKLSLKSNFMQYLTPLLLVVFMLLKVYCPYLSGNGSLMFNLSIIDLGILMLGVTLIFRIFGTALSVSSHTSGGVVLPMLAVGALSGYIVVSLISLIDKNILEYMPIFVVCGMMIVFTVVTKCPLTAFVLGLKCMDISIIIFPLIISILISYIIIEKLLKNDTLYHSLEKLIPGYSNRFNLKSNLTNEDNIINTCKV